MVILLLGGTREGREVAHVLHARGFPVMVSVVTDYGAKFVGQAVPVHRGRFEEEDLRDFCRRHGVRFVVDATHPFAQGISVKAIKVAKEEGIPYLRYERKPVRSTYQKLEVVSSFEEAREALQPFQVILLTIGVSHLHTFVSLREAGKKLFVRVLPTSASLRRCESLGFSPQEIIAFPGPGSVEMNFRLFVDFEVEAVVSKESGVEGGTQVKIEAAQRANITVVLIRRPTLPYPVVVESIAELLEKLEGWYRI